MTEPAAETQTEDTEVSDTESPTVATEVPEETQSESESEPETFPRSYVEDLRQENGRYRQRAQQADVYGQRLYTELVRATGRLADPTDLPFNADHLDDLAALTAAIDDLLTRKPHLVNRRPTGDIGQGAASGEGSTVDLAAILRQQAQ